MFSGVGVIYADSDPLNIDIGNIKAACKLCEALHAGGCLNSVESVGRLIYMPNVSQIALIRLAHGFHAVKRIKDIPLPFISEIHGKEMGKLSLLAEEKLGFSDTKTMANFLSIITPVAYADRKKAMGGIRWWPNTEIKTVSDFLGKYKETFLTKEELDAFSESC